ncbi:hypothetical protein [Sinorhizobium medicae]|uniref:hypothetical protein n=1 Tax=Sinorhizobium medicae TaxID=110321 RepID=UPI000FD76C52|nr:hypothetical protein [Sinorhizobium medicae]RVO69940.1 hypothetical protein CN084_31235 [Sinorhizobium medicae]
MPGTRLFRCNAVGAPVLIEIRIVEAGFSGVGIFCTILDTVTAGIADAVMGAIEGDIIGDVVLFRLGITESPAMVCQVGDILRIGHEERRGVDEPFLAEVTDESCPRLPASVSRASLLTATNGGSS